MTKVIVNTTGGSRVAISGQQNQTVRTVGVESGLSLQALETANQAYYYSNLAYVTVNQIAGPVYDRANLSVLKAGDTMTGALFFDTGIARNTAVGNIQTQNGIDLFAPNGADWAQLNYNNVNFIWVTSTASSLSTNNALLSLYEDGNVAINSYTANSFFKINDLLYVDHQANLTTPGNVSAAYFYGNGAALTGIVTDFSPAFNQANAAYERANTKYSSTGGLISGDVSITGNLSVTGNTTKLNVTNYSVEDSLIYLADKNYITDSLVIGFVANYNNGACATVHTGLIRDPTTKEYYLFQGYDKEPSNNIIDITGNNFSLSVLNADINTNNLWLNNTNTQSWITSAYNQANAAYTLANTKLEKAYTVRTVTSSNTLLLTDDLILTDGTLTLTLPNALSYSGQSYDIKNINTGMITIVGTGADLIDGYANVIILFKNSMLGVRSTGSSWIVY
jgi:hypothetical protein